MRQTSKPLRIVLAGGSGQVGRVLSRHFSAEGHEVVILARSHHAPGTPAGETINASAAQPRTVVWDGVGLGDWIEELEGADVLINLAGRSVNCRYGPKNRREIMQSRVRTTIVLGKAIGKVAAPPRLWMNASTATIYRHSFDREMDEAGEIGGNEPDVPSLWRFSIEVATGWESSFFACETPKTRKIALRTAMLMSPDEGGTFDLLLRLVRFGLGGASGTGTQYVSWIHDADLTRAISYLIDNEEFSGPVNLAAPAPIPNRDFIRAIREAWGVRFGLPAAKWMLEMGAIALRTETELLLKSRRVIPGKLLEAGFRFTFSEWNEAVQDLVRRRREQVRDHEAKTLIKEWQEDYGERAH
jgi:uncharacterized protein